MAIAGDGRGHAHPIANRVCLVHEKEERLIECREEDDAITFRVRVVPRASLSAVVGEHDGALRVRVAAPPVEGAANEELIRTLARALGVAPRAVEITSGHASKLKQVRVRGTQRSTLESLAREK